MAILYYAGLFLSSKINQVRIVKIEARGLKLEASKNEDVSVFNKYLDEIIYIIQSNKYDYILFEDLDRLENSDRLFLKIRELNMLINESDTFKRRNRVVRFIYAIRDDVFSRDLRTKCFDYIVSVVPVVDHYNVLDYLIRRYEKDGLFKTVDVAVLEQLLSNVAGLRELKNIVNEYTLFEKSLRVHMSEDADKYEQKLLAVIIYKNLYPDDFASVYSKKGLFYSVFKNKKLFYDDLTMDLRSESEEAQREMDDARKSIIKVRRHYLDLMNKDIEVTKLIKDGYDYTLEQVATRDNLFNLFESDGFDRYTYYEEGSDYEHKSDYDFVFEDLEGEGYYADVSDFQNTYRRLNDKRIRLEKKIKVIENTALRELIIEIGTAKTKTILAQICNQEYSGDDKKSQAEKMDMIDTLHSMLLGGYITENYYLYISKFYEGTTSESDFQFVNAILQGAERPYDYKLNNPKAIMGKFRVEDFKNRNILNYDILNYLLKNKQEHFLSTFVVTARQTPEFIVNYYQMAMPVNNDFFTHVFSGWDSCVEVIRGQEKAEYSEVLLMLFFREAPDNIKLKDKEIEYLNGKYEFINENLQSFSVAKLKRFVWMFRLRFEKLVVPVNQMQQEFYNCCLTTKHFVINKNNLEVILGDDFNTKPVTAILGITNTLEKKYLLGNLKGIIPLFGETCVDEDRSALVYLMKEKVEEDWLVAYIGKQQFLFDNLNGLNGDMVDVVLKSDAMLPAWGLAQEAFRIISSLNDNLKIFLIKHASELSKAKCVGEESVLRPLFEQLFLGERLPLNEFKLLLKSFDLYFTFDEVRDMTDDRIAEAIRQKKIAVDVNIFEYLDERSTAQNADDYFISHFDNLVEDDSWELDNYVRNSMCIHVLDSKLTLTQKKFFLDNYALIENGEPDSGALARLVCFYYNLCEVRGARKSLLIDALNQYQEANSWEAKIILINKCNNTWEYDTDIENQLLRSLGGEYIRFTYPRGWAELEKNDHNKTLIYYLKDKGHFINNIEEREDRFFVTFKHS